MLSLLVSGIAFAQGNFSIFVAGHTIGLKATQLDNGQVIPVANFEIAPESVVSVKQGENLLVMTSTNEPQRVEKVKVTDNSGKVTELVPTQPNVYSLSGLQAGVYVLNVIAENPDPGGRNAYETILVILGPNQKPLSPAQYLTYVTIETDFEWVFDKCSNEAGSAGMGFPYENVSECEVEGEYDCRVKKMIVTIVKA